MKKNYITQKKRRKFFNFIYQYLLNTKTTRLKTAINAINGNPVLSKGRLNDPPTGIGSGGSIPSNIMTIIYMNYYSHPQQ